MSKKQYTEVRIKSISEESYSIKQIGRDFQEKFDVDNLSVSFGLKTHFTDGSHSVLVLIPTVAYIYNEGSRKGVELMKVVCRFEYEIKLENNTAFVPATIMEDLVLSTFHTVRGILLIRTAGGFLSQYPLQLFDSKDFVEKLLGKPQHEDDPIKPLKTRTVKSNVKKSL